MAACCVWYEVLTCACTLAWTAYFNETLETGSREFLQGKAIAARVRRWADEETISAVTGTWRDHGEPHLEVRQPSSGQLTVRPKGFVRGPSAAVGFLTSKPLRLRTAVDSGITWRRNFARRRAGGHVSASSGRNRGTCRTRAPPANRPYSSSMTQAAAQWRHGGKSTWHCLNTGGDAELPVRAGGAVQD